MTILNGELTLEQTKLLPSESDIEFYEQHGWYKSPFILPEEVINLALEGAEKFYRGERDAILKTKNGFVDWTPHNSQDLRNNEFVSLQKHELRQLVLNPVLGAIAAKLTRSSEIRLLDDQLISKPPKTNTPIGWHTDRSYWATCSSDKLLTAWIPLLDCDESLGPLVVIDGSHHWEGLEHMRLFNDSNLEELEAEFVRQGKEVVKVPMVLKKGQVSFHNCWTVHGSYANSSNQTRTAMSVHYQDRENHYRPYWDLQGKEVHMFDEQLCRKLPNGDPDFSDPHVFPVVWSASSKEQSF